MDNLVQSFSVRGKKNFAIQMPSEIISLAQMDLQRVNSGQNMIVALKNGQVRIYSDKALINIMQTDAGPTGMIFGTFGREEGCLVLNHRSGAICAKILQRQAKLAVQSSKNIAPPEQEIPLKIPQKTTLFVELT